MTNPGPPFAVGGVILCNVGSHGLQQAFVIMSDHPYYQLRLEVGITVKASTQEAWMAPCLNSGSGNPNYPATDANDPFVSIRRKVELGQGMGKQRMGLHGVHVDAQSISLMMVEEAKVFVKAVKADDVEVPEYLWNDRIKSGCTPKEEWDAALIGFQWLGYHLFRKGLVKDCTQYLANTYGAGWRKKSRKSKDAIGDFWFPTRYQREARDGIKSFFEGRSVKTTHIQESFFVSTHEKTPILS